MEVHVGDDLGGADACTIISGRISACCFAVGMLEGMTSQETTHGPLFCTIFQSPTSMPSPAAFFPSNAAPTTVRLTTPNHAPSIRPSATLTSLSFSRWVLVARRTCPREMGAWSRKAMTEGVERRMCARGVGGRRG